MIHHSAISILFIAGSIDATLSSLLSYLRSMPHIRLAAQPQLPGDLSSYDVVISFNGHNPDDTLDTLTQYADSGGGWLMLVDAPEPSLPPVLGVQQEPLGSPAELRVLFENAEHPVATRLPISKLTARSKKCLMIPRWIW